MVESSWGPRVFLSLACLTSLRARPCWRLHAQATIPRTFCCYFKAGCVRLPNSTRLATTNALWRSVVGLAHPSFQHAYPRRSLVGHTEAPHPQRTCFPRPGLQCGFPILHSKHDFKGIGDGPMADSFQIPDCQVSVRLVQESPEVVQNPKRVQASSGKGYECSGFNNDL